VRIRMNDLDVRARARARLMAKGMASKGGQARRKALSSCDFDFIFNPALRKNSSLGIAL